MCVWEREKRKEGKREDVRIKESKRRKRRNGEAKRVIVYLCMSVFTVCIREKVKEGEKDRERSYVE